MKQTPKKHLLHRRNLLITGLTVLMALSACLPVQPELKPTPSAEITSAPRASVTPSPAPSPSPTPTPAALIAVEEARLMGTVIRFWHPWSGATGRTIQALVDEFNRTNEHQIKVEVVGQPGGWDDLENRITGALETGEPPDLAVGFAHQAVAWDAQQAVVDLEAYIGDAHWGLAPDAATDFYPAVWEADPEERLVFPLLPAASLFIYNVSWAQELGYRTPPVTIQQFADQACAASDAYRKDAHSENDGAGGYIASPDYAAALNWIYAFGGSVANRRPDDDGRIYTFGAPEAQDALIFLRELYDDGCAWATDQAYTEEEFARRGGLFATANLLDLPYVAQAVQRAGRSDRWAVIPYPSDDDLKRASLSNASLLILSSSPERQLAAWLLIKWLAQPSNHARLVQASGAFPLRVSELALLEDYRIANPQWSMALDLLPGAVPEPAYPSWGEVRWALADAFTQLFRSYFEAKNIPTMLDYLDTMSIELHTGKLPEDLFTPVPTPAE